MAQESITGWLAQSAKQLRRGRENRRETRDCDCGYLRRFGRIVSGPGDARRGAERLKITRGAIWVPSLKPTLSQQLDDLGWFLRGGRQQVSSASTREDEHRLARGRFDLLAKPLDQTLNLIVVNLGLVLGPHSVGDLLSAADPSAVLVEEVEEGFFFWREMDGLTIHPYCWCGAGRAIDLVYDEQGEVGLADRGLRISKREDRVSDVDPVTVAQRRWTFDELTVDERSVGAVEVA